MKPRKHSIPGSKPISSIMSHDFAVVRDIVNVALVAKFLLERGITCAAVSDESDSLIGYVSMIDLVRERYINGDTDNDASARTEMRRGFNGDLKSGFHVESTPRATARDIMMPFVLRLREDAPIDEAAALMAFERVHRVLVVSKSGKLVGIVSALDVLRWLAIRDGYTVPENAKKRWRDSCEYAT